MKSFVRIGDRTKEELLQLFQLVDEVQKGRYKDCLKGKTVLLFFPNTSLRTRVTFEKGIHSLGGQVILFPSETLDKKEELRDVCGYLNQWVDLMIVRHKEIHRIEQLAKLSKFPVINAMTDVNHPCEIITDLYALSKIRNDFLNDKYLFCGKSGNIGLSWLEAAKVFGFELVQCCPIGYEMENVTVIPNLEEAVKGRDVICTDSLSTDDLKEFREYQITSGIMQEANQGAVLNPCPPFYRGEEVSAEVIDSKYFVGYEFKRHLLEVQQAIIIDCLGLA